MPLQSLKISGALFFLTNFSRLEYFLPFAKLFLPWDPIIRYSSPNE